MLIKATAVTNLTDARYYAAKEVDYLGFNLEEGTEGYLDPMYMKAIREWVTGPHIVGEFSTLPVSHVKAAAEFFGLDAVQLSAEKHLADLPQLAGLEIILRLNGGQDKTVLAESMQHAAPHVSCFLLDFSSVNDWESILNEDPGFWNNLFDLRPTLLQASFSAEQLSPLFETLNFAGISLVGGEEEMVGVKSFDQIEEIFEAFGL